jgi:hypothetical protein
MNNHNINTRICKIESTSDNLTSRGGLALFNRYMDKTGVLDILGTSFHHVRRNRKGISVRDMARQVLCWLADGTSRHLTYFDKLKKDSGYAATIEETQQSMASSHSVKRFFGAFSWRDGRAFRAVLRDLFVWRLNQEKPSVIELTIDSMVMDNDDASERQGVSPTYRKVKGFQPLHVLWNGMIVDAIFRGGKKHCNHGDTVRLTALRLIETIRERYSPDVTIIFKVDSGFYDEDILTAINDAGSGIIVAGKMYDSIINHVENTDVDQWKVFEKGRNSWKYTEFGHRGKTWKRFWRTVYTKPLCTEGQQLLEFARPESIIVTNIGVNPAVTRNLPEKDQGYWLDTETLIDRHHSRGKDELIHRGFKDFGFEQLPFKGFGANTAMYYFMVIGFLMFESFKTDILSGIVEVTSYATTVRRIAIDFAGKIVKTGHEIIMKVSEATHRILDMQRLWRLCNKPPEIIPA